jgi:hypothetical protein
MSVNRVRLVLSLTGMLLAVVAIMLKDRRLVWGAMALLTGSIILRLAQRGKGPGGGEP